MTVQELIDELNKIENKDRQVIMAKDAEGNGYSPLSSFWLGAYRAETTWCGDVGFESVDDLEEGYDEEDVIDDGEPAVILCSVN
jgi:hypothetical protein